MHLVGDVDRDRREDLVGVVADLRHRIERALPGQRGAPGGPSVVRYRHPGLVEGTDLGVVASGCDIRLYVVTREPQGIHGPRALVDGDPTGDRVARGVIRV